MDLFPDCYLLCHAWSELLERGDQVSDFVMRDKDRGYVEVELKDTPSNHVIRRELDKESNK